MKYTIQNNIDLRGYKVDSIFILLFVASIIIFSYQEGNSYITKLLSLPLVIIFAIRIILLNYKIIIPIEFYLVGLWLLYSIISGIFAIDFDVFIHQYLICIQVIGIAFILFNLLFWLNNPTLISLCIYISTLAMSVYVFHSPKLYYIQDRLAGRLNNANLYALALILSYVYALKKILSSKYISIKLIFFASIPFILFLIGETGSRKGIVGVVLLSLLVMLFHYGEIIKKSLLYGILLFLMFIAIIIISFYFISESKHIHRLENVFSYIKSGNITEVDSSLRGRIKFYEYGWRTVVEHPFLGVGLNNFSLIRAGSSYSSIGTYAHSNIIELMASTGFVGFAIYYSIYISIVVKLVKLKKRLWNSWSLENKENYIATFALILVFIMYDFAMVSYYEKLSWVILSSIIASTEFLRKTIV